MGSPLPICGVYWGLASHGGPVPHGEDGSAPPSHVQGTNEGAEVLMGSPLWQGLVECPLPKVLDPDGTPKAGRDGVPHPHTRGAQASPHGIPHPWPDSAVPHSCY